MKFDYTHGKPAKFMVTVYGWNIEDRFLYNTYADAEKQYKIICAKDYDNDWATSLYDLVKDERKAYHKF